MSVKQSRRNSFNAISLQLDPQVSGSQLLKSGRINGRAGEPYRCVYNNLGHIHIPSYSRSSPFLKDTELELDENETPQYTDFNGNANEPEYDADYNDDDFDDELDYDDVEPSSSPEHEQIRNKIENRDEDDESTSLHNLPIKCGHEHALVDPHTGHWTSSCLEHGFEAPAITESIFGLQSLFRNPPSYDRTDALRGEHYNATVKEPAQKAMQRTLIKDRMRRRKNRGEKEFEGFDQDYE